MPYNLAPRLKKKDLPEVLEPLVESVLEVDKLFWLDPKNAGQKQFERKFVPGEERPMQLPVGTDKKGNPLTVVLVARWGRTFVVDGKVMLLIEDNPPKAENEKLKKVKPDHATGIKNTLQEFRRFMGEYARQVAADRGRSVARKPTTDERVAQSKQDKQRAQERRERNYAARAATIAAKRNRKRDASEISSDSAA